MEDLIALRGFIEKNKNKLNNWSLVLVNASKKDKINDWKSDFYIKEENGYKKHENKPISALKRKGDKDGSALYFGSILNAQSDNIFDIVDESNCEDYPAKVVDPGELRQADIAKKFRNKSGKPMLLVYPVKIDNWGIVPLLYFFIPKIDGADKVRYIVRNK